MQPGDKAVKFINGLTHTKGIHAGEPFNLRKWQEDDIIRPLFGTLNLSGLRQYRTCYMELPRKNGKSELCAAIALYLLCADGEIGAEIYSAAAEQEQASLVFNVAAQMVRNNPILDARLKIIDSRKRIVDYKTGNFYRALSADAKSKHGFNAHAVIYDELHVAPNRDLWDVLTTSSGARTQPIHIAITTAGHDKHSICYEQSEYAKALLAGTVEDENYLPIIYTVDNDSDGSPLEDAWHDEKQWHKANPALGDFRSLEEMRIAYKRACEIPAQENNFKRLYLNIWTESESKWLNVELWKKCANENRTKAMAGKPCFVGMDLSTRIDITAIVLYFPGDDDNKPYVIPFFYMPAENLIEREKRDKVPYRQWKAAGHITTTPGNVIDYQYIYRDITEKLGDLYSIQEIGFDPWNATQISLELAEAGFEMVEIRQGVKSMGEPSKDLEAMILSEEIEHDNNPVMNWMAGSVTVRIDVNGNYMPQKPDRKAAARIDGIVSLIMAIARANIYQDQKTSSIYEQRGLVTIE